MDQFVLFVVVILLSHPSHPLCYLDYRLRVGVVPYFFLQTGITAICFIPRLVLALSSFPILFSCLVHAVLLFLRPTDIFCDELDGIHSLFLGSLNFTAIPE